MIPLVGKIVIGLYLAFFVGTATYFGLQPATCAESQGYHTWVRWQSNNDSLHSRHLGQGYACSLGVPLAR